MIFTLPEFFNTGQWFRVCRQWKHLRSFETYFCVARLRPITISSLKLSCMNIFCFVARPIQLLWIEIVFEIVFFFFSFKNNFSKRDASVSEPKSRRQRNHKGPTILKPVRTVYRKNWNFYKSWKSEAHSYTDDESSKFSNILFYSQILEKFSHSPFYVFLFLFFIYFSFFQNNIEVVWDVVLFGIGQEKGQVNAPNKTRRMT